MTTPEKKVKDKVKAILKGMGVYYFMPATHGYGSSGVPDLIACIKGKLVAIECKANGGTTTALQEKNLMDICANGGIAIKVDETGTQDLKMFLSVLDADAGGMYIDYLRGKK
jgi:Holliday junction resolvase